MGSTTGVGGAAQRHCRLVVTEFETIELEDGDALFVHFRCTVHGAQWRSFVGGTTKRSCITRALECSEAETSANLPSEELTCDVEDSDGAFDE